ncbi:hypothetical protein ABZ922_39675 [Streptomyces shenzhenensis]|uniref:hypothetical protein n=1 Tax=Streptomyces shenzhenensis TaxID=943815 RepID=UPI0033DC3FFC
MLTGELAKQPQGVQDGREELLIAERALNRLTEQDRAAAEAAAARSCSGGGRGAR